MHDTVRYCIITIYKRHLERRYAMDSIDYEAQCKKIRKTNDEYLAMFREDLKKSGLKENTISRHLGNVDFYINDFLLYYDALPMESGLEEIDSFLGDFFIRKCMWSTPATIRSTAASLKKFYKSMLNHGFIKPDAYQDFCQEIKDSMNDWQSDCAQFNDPDASNPFMFF